MLNEGNMEKEEGGNITSVVDTDVNTTGVLCLILVSKCEGTRPPTGWEEANRLLSPAAALTRHTCMACSAWRNRHLKGKLTIGRCGRR